MSGNDTQLHYSMVIQWSEEDAAFLVTLPEWEKRVFNPVTHGDTYEEAAANGKLALEDLIFVARKNGEQLPKPHYIEVAA